LSWFRTSRCSWGGLRAVARAVALAATLAATLAVVVAGAPRPAAAFVLWEEPLEGSELTLGGSLKSFFLALHGDSLDLRPFGADADPTALGLLVLRPACEGQVGDTWRFALHYEMAATVSSVDTAAATGPVAIGRGLPPPRFLPLAWRPVSAGTFVWNHVLDWAWTRVRLGPVDVTVGRQPITFGRGYLWQPSDLLATFSPTEIDTEFKPGVDALRVDVALSPTALLTLVAVAGELQPDVPPVEGAGSGSAAHDLEATLAGSAFAARAKVGFDRFELGAFAGYVRRDAVFGLDGFVDLKTVSLHAEATLTWVPDQERAAADGDVFVRAVAGVVWTIPKLRLVGELYYNGVGGADPEDYFARALGTRAAIGEVYNLGRYYAGVLANWEVHPLLSLTLVTLANLRDPSALLAPGLVYGLAANVQLVTGAYVPLGRGLDRSGLVPQARSELGSYPYFYYLELKAAL
jgi:hypothetical protein